MTRIPRRMQAAMDMVEYKFQDQAFNFETVTVGGEVTGTQLLIVQGDTESQRDGRKVVMKSMQIILHGFVSPQALAGTTNSHETLRFIVVHDRQCNGAIPAISEIFDNANWDAFRNLQNINRFNFLYDKIHRIKVQTVADFAADTLLFTSIYKKIYIKLNMPIEYSGTTGAIGTIKSNNIFFLAFSEKGIVNINGNTRIRWVG